MHVIITVETDPGEWLVPNKNVSSLPLGADSTLNHRTNSYSIQHFDVHVH